MSMEFDLTLLFSESQNAARRGSRSVVRPRPITDLNSLTPNPLDALSNICVELIHAINEGINHLWPPRFRPQLPHSTNASDNETAARQVLFTVSDPMFAFDITETVFTDEHSGTIDRYWCIYYQYFDYIYFWPVLTTKI